MASRGFVLTFHSHNISGQDYATNDHVALDGTLTLLARLRVPVLRLLDVVRSLRAGTFPRLPARFACITFDDGSDYDWRDLEFRGHGVQRSMGSILGAHSRKLLGLLWVKRAHATSFVIASPEARREIAATALGDAALMTDSWWREAQRSGLMDLGTHGWDHVHPAVSSMSSRSRLIERFDQVDDAEEAGLQVDRAGAAIRRLAGHGAARIFAYPYGQVSEFLASEYFPRQSSIIAAVGTTPEPVTAQSDPWRLPRYVCGHHWQSEDDLRALIAS